MDITGLTGAYVFMAGLGIAMLYVLFLMVKEREPGRKEVFFVATVSILTMAAGVLILILSKV